MTTTDKRTITGRAIANRLRGKGYTGARLERAIQEVADDMHGRDTIAGQFLAEIFETDPGCRSWDAVRRIAKRTIRIIDGAS